MDLDDAGKEQNDDFDLTIENKKLKKSDFQSSSKNLEQ